MKREEYLRRMLIGLVVSLGIVFGASLTATVQKHVGEKPVNEPAKESSNGQEQEESFWEWVREAAFPDSIAAYTFVLTAATIGLWFSTHRLWRAGKEQFALTNDIFIAENRPILGFQSIQISAKTHSFFEGVNGGLHIYFDVILKNHGHGPATSVMTQIEPIRGTDGASKALEAGIKAISLRGGRSGLSIFPSVEMPFEEYSWVELAPSDRRQAFYAIVTYRLIGGTKTFKTAVPFTVGIVTQFSRDEHTTVLFKRNDFFMAVLQEATIAD
ncbi:MAG: hypothetical protein M3O03_15285 [Pseudomonadota bacterium]|nr:hypothetical protein [Pseudomonadota bacterium]